MSLTWDGGGQEFLEVVPEGQLVARHQEARPEKEGPPQAQEGLVRQPILGGRTPFGLHRLQHCSHSGGLEITSECLQSANADLLAPCFALCDLRLGTAPFCLVSWLGISGEVRAHKQSLLLPTGQTLFHESGRVTEDSLRWVGFWSRHYGRGPQQIYGWQRVRAWHSLLKKLAESHLNEGQALDAGTRNEAALPEGLEEGCP